MLPHTKDSKDGLKNTFFFQFPNGYFIRLFINIKFILVCNPK